MLLLLTLLHVVKLTLPKVVTVDVLTGPGGLLVLLRSTSLGWKLKLCCFDVSSRLTLLF